MYKFTSDWSAEHVLPTEIGMSFAKGESSIILHQQGLTRVTRILNTNLASFEKVLFDPYNIMKQSQESVRGENKEGRNFFTSIIKFFHLFLSKGFSVCLVKFTRRETNIQYASHIIWDLGKCTLKRYNWRMLKITMVVRTNGVIEPFFGKRIPTLREKH